MNDHTNDAGNDPSEGGQHEPVGTLGEEAAKLFAAASAWAREQQAHAPRDSSSTGSSNGSSTGEAPCTWCPICKAATFVRSTDPQLSAALGAAMVSLTDLARAALDALAEHQRHERPTGEGDDAWA